MPRQVFRSATIALTACTIGCSAETPEPTESAASADGDKTAVAAAPAEPSPVDAVAETPKAPTADDPYRQQANALVAAIDSGADAAAILVLADELTATGLSMLPAMKTEHPICGAYLDAITAVGATLKDLPLEEIESGYHSDGKLPPMPSAECYHGKDLVVHPATVAAMAKAGLGTPEDRRSAKGEIVEVLGHLMAIEPAPSTAE